MAKLRVGILEFGEAGQSVATGLKKSATAEHPIEISTWDILLPSNEKGAPLKAAADKIGVRTVGSAAELAQASDIILSLVTTEESLVAARQMAPHIVKGTLFLDCNSTSPGMKRDVAKTITAGGGRSVEAAVM
ncbi:MAG: NAD(P)-dependent oxidoreductase, partial [Hyphomicrobium sp.]|nr:NAD(P)-dependent oxidoreductase [Hyphomicrobium sp.]